MCKPNVKPRGPFALIKMRTGLIAGTAEMIGCEAPPVTAEAYATAEAMRRIPAARQVQALADGWRTPSVLKAAKALLGPIPYSHPNGAVIWVNLSDSVLATLTAQSR